MNELTERVRRERLAKLTVEEAGRDYDSLVWTLGIMKPDANNAALERRRIEEHIELRRKFWEAYEKSGSSEHPV